MKRVTLPYHSSCHMKPTIQPIQPIHYPTYLLPHETPIPIQPIFNNPCKRKRTQGREASRLKASSRITWFSCSARFMP